MNITYYLGAGASAKAIPVVANSVEGFRLFHSYLERIVADRKEEIEKELALEIWNLIADYGMLVSNVSNHMSYDTYAKKIWLLDQTHMLSRLKEFISLYYTYANFNYYHYNSEMGVEVPIEYDQNFWSSGQITKGVNFSFRKDMRYESFIAGVVKANKSKRVEIPSNISMITWNYDVQFDYALSWFTNLDDDINYLFNPTIEGVEKQPAVFVLKLNGSSGYNILGNTNNGNLKDVKIVPILNKRLHPVEHIFNCLRSYAINTNVVENKPFINFAWEDNIVSKCIIKKGKEIIGKTHSLIVIGYSFPLFNREVDKEILNELNLAANSFIYIQTDTDRSFEEIRSRLNGLINIDQNKIVFIKDINQFYVPFELNSEPSLMGGKYL